MCSVFCFVTHLTEIYLGIPCLKTLKRGVENWTPRLFEMRGPSRWARDKLSLFLLEISTVDNSSRAGGDWKDNITRIWKWSLYWMKPHWTQCVYVIFQCRLWTYEASCLLKNTSIKELLVALRFILVCILSPTVVSQWKHLRTKWGLTKPNPSAFTCQLLANQVRDVSERQCWGFQGWGTGTGSWTLPCAPGQLAGK